MTSSQLAEHRIAEVAVGRGRLLLLAGEAGIGKSRLLRAVLERAAAAGFRWTKSDIAPYDQQVVLASVVDLARWMPVAEWGDLGARLLAVDRAQGPDALGSRRSLVSDLVEMFRGAVDRPTLLAFEDLQWADEMSLEVVAELARGSQDVPLLIVGVYRVNELPAGSIHREWRARLLTQRLAEEARLQRLTEEQTALVTTLLLGTGLPAPREVVEAVYTRTNGIPLHIEELLAAVGGSATDGRSILGAHVPDTIEDAILAHAGRLSGDREPSRARVRSWGGASPPTSSPASWTGRSASSRRRSMSLSAPGSSSRSTSSTRATTTSVTSCCATRSTTTSRRATFANSTLEPRSSGPT